MLLRILVVDAQPKFLQMVKESVTPIGWCELLTAQTSQEALASVQHQKLDGLLVEARMPDLDGFEITRRARASALNGSIPIVMFSGQEDVKMMREGFKAGVTFFAPRPADGDHVQKLFASVRGIMVTQNRRFLRLPYRTAVTCRWKDNEERHFVAESLDIGERGMALTPSGGLEEGQEVELELVLSAEARASGEGGRALTVEEAADPQVLRGVVRYKIPPDTVGVEFTDLQPAQRQAIQSYINGGIEE